MRAATFRAALLAVVLAPLILVAVFASPASACPFCDGGPSGVNQVRAGIFDHNFWPRVAATLAPFPVLVGIVALIYFGPPGFTRDRADGVQGQRAAPSTEGGSSSPGPRTNDGGLSCQRQEDSTAGH